MSVIEVAIPVALYKTFDYECDFDVKVGSVVSVNFSNRETFGLVINIKKSSDFPLKKINNVFNQFKSEFVNFLIKVSEYNIIPIGLVFKFAFNEKFISNKMKEEKVYSFFQDGKITEKQENIFNFLKENNGKSFYFKELKHFCSLNILKTLVKNNIIKENIENFYDYNIKSINLNKLSDEQEDIFNSILKNNNKPILLEGVTGSGKTEIYFHLFEYFIKQDKQVLFLLPEIALTSQFIDRIKKQFICKDLAIWHSNISDSQKREIWNKVLNNEIKIVIGARSSLFLPFHSLSLIVVDEEHDSSYKQVDNGSYNARDMAVLRSSIESFCVVLGSATPSIESIINVSKNKYNHFILKNRYGESIKPIINIVDLKKEKPKQGKYLSNIMIENIKLELDKKNQVLLFMNRRGYSPVALCRECGERVLCPKCNISLTFHKSSGFLMCHQCGYKKKENLNCEYCGSENSIIYFGPGVEKINEEVKEIFSNKNSVIITSDTIQNIKEINNIIDRILNREIDIIIGTQMITKGYDFPFLTMVGVLDADASLFGANFRTTESTYQLLTQVVGRAGRRSEQGKAFIQTYSPDNVIIQALKNNDKDLLINFETENRKLMNLPPFGNIVLIIASGKDEFKVYRKIKEISSFFPFNDNVDVFGISSMSKINDDFRFRIIVKTSRNINIQKLVLYALNRVNFDFSVKIKVEVNPYFIG